MLTNLFNNFKKFESIFDTFDVIFSNLEKTDLKNSNIFKSNNLIFKYESIENSDSFLIKVEVPGYSKEDLKISLIDNKLYIKSINDKKIEYSLNIKESIFSKLDLSNIKSSTENGILTISFSYKETSKTEIEIK